MEEPKLGAIESRFADLIWSHQPLTSGELVKLCLEELSWKKSTTYTVLKKLCEKGILSNESSTVRSAVPREAVDPRKQQRLRSAAAMYLSQHELDAPARFDVAEVYTDENHRITGVTYLTDAFQ